MTSLRTRSLPSLALLATSLLLAACGGGSKTATDGSTTPPAGDETPPFTSASPGTGLYPSIQFVTLSANEPAIIYYTTDGFTPTIGGTTTTQVASPASGIVIDHPLSLKYFAVDAAGNQETVKTSNYTFDLDPPSILISDFLTGTYGFLEVIHVKFSSDEQGSWVVEIGGNGSIGSGVNVNTGFMSAFQEVDVPLNAWRLPVNQQSPGNSVWAYVLDQAGGLAAFEFEIKTMADEAFSAPGSSTDLELTPDGSFGYLLRPQIAEVWKFDTDPLSLTFNQFVSFINVGANPTSLAITPDSARVYVTHDGGFSEIDVATDFVTPIAMPGGRTPSGIAIQPDELDGYVAANDGTFWGLDVNPLSGGFRTSTQLPFSEPLMTAAEIVLSPFAERAVIAWTSPSMYGVQALDTDPMSPTFLAAPFKMIEATLPLTVGSPVLSADASQAWIGSSLGLLQRLFLNTIPPTLSNSSPSLTVRGMTLTPDEQFLMLTGGPLNGIRFASPVTLQTIHSVTSGGTSGTGTSRAIRYSADGKRAYLVRDNDSATGEVWMLWLTSQ